MRRMHLHPSTSPHEVDIYYWWLYFCQWNICQANRFNISLLWRLVLCDCCDTKFWEPQKLMETILSYFQRSFLGYASFKVGDLLKSKEQVLTLSLRWVSMLLNLTACDIYWRLVGFESHNSCRCLDVNSQTAYVLLCNKLQGNSNYSGSYSSLCFTWSKVVSSCRGKKWHY